MEFAKIERKFHTFNFISCLSSMNLPGFIEERILGKGSYGKVYKAKRINDGQSYAVKVINLHQLNHREIEDSVNEIRLMASFTSPYIITFYQAFCDAKRLCIVTEYSRLGDLAHLIDRRKRQNRPIKENDIWRFLIQLLEGLKVLHNAGVVHRDIKSANVLMSAPDLIKIADLGISTVLHHYPHYQQLAKTQIGTPLYLAPEIWKKRPYDHKCDIWSLGVFLYEMMTFNFPFLGRTDRELSQRICSGYYVPPRGYSSDLISVLRRLLQVNPVNRPTVDDLLNLKCIKDRANLINSTIIPGYDEDIQSETVRKMIQPSPSDSCLLSTIKIPNNMRNMNLPRPMYGKRANIVKPLEQRMHLKQGAPVRKELGQISSPELKVICDKDWWSPNKLGPASAPDPVEQTHMQRQIPQQKQPQLPLQPKGLQNPRTDAKHNENQNDNTQINELAKNKNGHEFYDPHYENIADNAEPQSARPALPRPLPIANARIKQPLIPSGKKPRAANPRVNRYKHLY